jgi:O-antigen/teichoic acid export membrane protein
MISRRNLFDVMTVQGVGVLASIGLNIAVAARFGPEGQAFWASYRSAVDFLVILSLLGLPTGFPYFFNVLGLTMSALTSAAFRFGVLGLALSTIISIGMYLAAPEALPATGARFLFAAIVTVAALMVYEVISAMCLVARNSRVFNYARVILPLAAFCIFGLSALEDTSDLVNGYLLAALVAAATGAAVWLFSAPTSDGIADRQEALPHATLLTQSGMNYGLAVARYFFPVLFYQILTYRNVDQTLIGQISMAILVVSAVTLPATLLGPLLYNAMTKISDATLIRAEFRAFALISFGYSIAAISVVAVVLTLLVPVAFPQYTDLPELFLAFSLLVPLAIVSQFVVNFLMSRGLVAAYALGTLLKLGVLAIQLSLGQTSSIHICLAYVISELACFVFCFAYMKAKLNQ